MILKIKRVLKAQKWNVKIVGDDFIVATSKGVCGELWMTTVNAETLMSTLFIIDSKGAPMGEPKVFKFSFPEE